MSQLSFQISKEKKISLLDLYYQLKLKEVRSSTLSIESTDNDEDLVIDLNNLDSELEIDLDQIKMVETEASVKIIFKFSRDSAYLIFQNKNLSNLIMADYFDQPKNNLLDSFIQL